MIFYPNTTGYEIFTGTIHQKPVTGIIHGVGTPIAAYGIFYFLYCLFGRETTTKILYFTLGFFSCGYITYSPYWGFVTIMFYRYLVSLYIRSYRGHNIPKALTITALPILCMEFIGHWYLEDKSSDVSQLINSIYHTPLYGVKSLFLLT